MSIADVAPKFLLGPLTLMWAAAALAGPGTLGNPHPAAGVTPTSSVMPSIEILINQPNLAGTCGGAAFDINTFINVDTQASADVHLSAPGFPVLEEFTDETGSNVGPFVGPYSTFTIQAFGGGLPPNTPIRITIDTYSGQALAGTLTYSSSMQYNCTTGAILNLVAAAPGDPVIIPTMSDLALTATALLLALSGLVMLRRRTGTPSRHRRDPR